MPITLAEAKVGMADKVDQQVIDEFRRASLLLDMLTFDDTVSPGTGGSTLTYLDALDTFISKLAEKPDILMMNTEMLTKTRSAARRAGYYDRSKDDFGRAVETYNGIKLLDAGEYYNGSTTEHVVPIEADGSTAIYGIKLGLNAFHGVSPKGDKIISQHLPDFSQAGAVKEGDVEMVAATVLKNSRMAGVLKGMKIKATE